VICFLDNDILLKLSAFDLLEATIEALQFQPEDLRVLDSAQFVFRRDRRVLAKYSQVIRERSIAFVQRCEVVQPSVSDEFRELRSRLDAGEATLVAATREINSFVLMTGDKRCLQVLAVQADLIEVTERLQGRVICLEQVILLLIRSVGFDRVKQRVLPEVECDMALRACFGSGEAAIEENVVAALEGYIEALRQDAPGLLADLSGF
jgi:hypothetical protein